MLCASSIEDFRNFGFRQENLGVVESQKVDLGQGAVIPDLAIVTSSKLDSG